MKKWCKKEGIDEKQYNLAFVDYLRTSTVNDRKQYWLVYHSLYKVYMLPKLLLKTIKRIFG